MASKHYPVKTKLSFDMAVGNSEDGDSQMSEIISLPRELSAHNRRMYRMNKFYAINGGTISIDYNEHRGDLSNFVFTVKVLGDTWFERQAYQEAFTQWLEMRDSADAPNDLKGRWNDWRVKMHTGQTSLLDSAPNANYGDFDMSDYTFFKSDGSVGTQVAYCHAMTDWNENDSDFSLTEAYKQLLMKPPVQVLPEADAATSLASSPYARFDTIETTDVGLEIMKDAIEEGANPPYAREYQQPSLETVYQGRLPSIGSTVMLPSFIAPLGYIQVTVRVDDDSATLEDDHEFNITLDVAKGAYKGVLAL